MAYHNFSPYYRTPTDSLYLDILEFRDIPMLASDPEFEILTQHEFRPDLLAFDLYGESRLWWVFAVRNMDKIKDPVYDLYSGQRIKLPQLETLRSIGL
jgi:hypothetical protein